MIAKFPSFGLPSFETMLQEQEKCVNAKLQPLYEQLSELLSRLENLESEMSHLNEDKCGKGYD